MRIMARPAARDSRVGRTPTPSCATVASGVTREGWRRRELNWPLKNGEIVGDIEERLSVTVPHTPTHTPTENQRLSVAGDDLAGAEF